MQEACIALGMMLQMAVQLVGDDTLPSLQLAALFPERDVCIQMCWFNRQTDGYLEQLQQLYVDPELDDFRRLNQKHYLFWDLARDATANFYSIRERREKLAAAIRMIGWENFIRRRFPTPIAIRD